MVVAALLARRVVSRLSRPSSLAICPWSRFKMSRIFTTDSKDSPRIANLAEDIVNVLKQCPRESISEVEFARLRALGNELMAVGIIQPQQTAVHEIESDLRAVQSQLKVMEATEKVSSNYNIFVCSVFFAGLFTGFAILHSMYLNYDTLNERSKGNEKRIHKLEIKNTLNDAKLGHSDDVVKSVGGQARDVEVAVKTCMLINLVKSQLYPEIEIVAKNGCVRKGSVYMGEASVDMLRNLGFSLVMVGHTHRRTLLGESDEVIAEKAAYAVARGLKVIVSVGETLEQRETGASKKAISQQMKSLAEKVKDWSNIIIVYEPSAPSSTEPKSGFFKWSFRLFGGQTPDAELEEATSCTAAQAQEVHASLRDWLNTNISPEVAHSTRIIYGGPVTSVGSKDLAKQHDIDGFLVDGLSLKPEFVDVLSSAAVKSP